MEGIASQNLTQKNEKTNKNNIFKTSIRNNEDKNNLNCTNNSANIRRTKKIIKTKVINKKNHKKDILNYCVIHNNSTNKNIIVKKKSNQMKDSSPIKIVENPNHNSLLNDYIYNNLYQKLKKKSPQRKNLQRKNLIKKTLNNRKTVLPKTKNTNLTQNKKNQNQIQKNEKTENDSNNENIASFFKSTNYISNDTTTNNNNYYISTLTNISNQNDFKQSSDRNITENEKSTIENISYINKTQKPIFKKDNNNIKICHQKKLVYKLKNNYNKTTLSVGKKPRNKKINNLIPKSRNIDFNIFNKNGSCPIFMENKNKNKSRNIQREKNTAFKTKNETTKNKSYKQHKNSSVLKKNINILKSINNTDNNKSKIKPKIKLLNNRVAVKSEKRNKNINKSDLITNGGINIKVN